MPVYKEKEKISLANIKTPAENANYRWLKKMTMGSYIADFRVLAWNAMGCLLKSIFRDFQKQNGKVEINCT